METAKFWNDRANELKSAIETDKAIAKTDAARMNALLAKLAAASDENGGTEAQRSAIVAELDAMRPVDEWTKEVTISRRMEWNTRVKSGEFNSKNGKVDMVKLASAERAQGWGMTELKAAVAKHGL